MRSARRRRRLARARRSRRRPAGRERCGCPRRWRAWPEYASPVGGSSLAGGADEREEPRSFVGCLDAEALELGAEADVGMEAGGILVEVEEGLRAPVEDAACALHEVRHAAQLGEEWLELVEGLRPCVAHRRDRTSAPGRRHAASWNTRPSVCRRPGADRAHAVAHRRRRPAAGRADRPLAGGEHEAVPAGDRRRRGPGLGTRTLLDDDELTAGVVEHPARRGR